MKRFKTKIYPSGETATEICPQFHDLCHQLVYFFMYLLIYVKQISSKKIKEIFLNLLKFLITFLNL